MRIRCVSNQLQWVQKKYNMVFDSLLRNKHRETHSVENTMRLWPWFRIMQHPFVPAFMA